MSSTVLPPLAQRLKGRVAIITGAAGGIGLAAAKLFHRNGAKVFVADIQDDLGRNVCSELSTKDNVAEYVHCDVTKEDDIRRAVDTAVKVHGRLDIMFSNVGIAETNSPMPSLVDYDASKFEGLMNVNVVGMFLAAKHAARMMIPAKRGSIILTASCASLMAGLGGHGYSTSKHAVVGLTKSLATELGKNGIRVNCISPYAMFTPASRRFKGLDEAEFHSWADQFANLKGLSLKVDDIAEAALYLAGDESKYISGHNLVVDGGFSVSDSACMREVYPMPRLKGRVAIVTGAAAGIGLAAAKLFHRHGAKVFIADIQDDLGRHVCSELSTKDNVAEYVHCDVTKEDDIRRAVDTAVEVHGRLDIMFSNVGIAETNSPMPSLVDYDASKFEELMNVNVVGMFLAAKHAARMMIPSKQGSIILMASCASLMAGLGGHGYCTSKHAVVGLTKSLATELGKNGIRVNCISPYVMFTPGSRRLMGLDEAEIHSWADQFANLKGLSLKVDDIAEAALYLAGDESKYISGHNLVVDGGLKGRVAIVTGAAAGIGLAAAKLFHRHGAKVFIADIQDDLGRHVCSELSTKDNVAEYVHCDVTKEDDIRRAVDTAVEVHGRLDIMFSNVGIAETNSPMPSLVDYDASKFEELMNVNVVGMFLAAKHAARMMIPSKQGSIILMASCASLMAGLGGHGYCTSKHAVVGLTKSLATELGKYGIRVNCISPYAVFTSNTTRFLGLDESEFNSWADQFANLKGLSKLDDIAEAALYLTGDESKYISGHNLVVDGGFSVSDSACNSFRATP
ncbi:Secoisolariciresinol dehydrogenase [Nymphaea thermarum]|nr:Secoisolariciresinol dehydrogenase [Nymphaea thermarum]